MYTKEDFRVFLDSEAGSSSKIYITVIVPKKDEPLVKKMLATNSATAPSVSTADAATSVAPAANKAKLVHHFNVVCDGCEGSVFISTDIDTNVLNVETMICVQLAKEKLYIKSMS